MVVSAISMVVLNFFLLFPLVFILSNILSAIAMIVWNEVKFYGEFGELSDMTANEFDWTTAIMYNSDLNLVYLVVGVYTLFRYIMWSIHKIKTAKQESLQKIRKEKEYAEAQEFNHNKRMIEMRNFNDKAKQEVNDVSKRIETSENQSNNMTENTNTVQSPKENQKQYVPKVQQTVKRDEEEVKQVVQSTKPTQQNKEEVEEPTKTSEEIEQDRLKLLEAERRRMEEYERREQEQLKEQEEEMERLKRMIQTDYMRDDD